MTQHDFIRGPVVSTPGLVGKDKAQAQSFICTLCRRTTTTPDRPEGECPGPDGLGPERTQFLQLVELRRIADLMQARAAALYPETERTL